ncbi:MAG: chemotaxis protein CheW, partial [Oscillospiraceae bacterium]|nr:chemotaxis protein CheW [Oscillospiraceae bacterium]
MCMRLGRPADEDNLVIVLDIEGTMIGILVNRVDQMIPVPVDSILPMPANSQEKMVTGMCTLPDSNDTMLVLDCPLLIHD